jgi:hypothetical protein
VHLLTNFVAVVDAASGAVKEAEGPVSTHFVTETSPQLSNQHQISDLLMPISTHS